MKCIAAGLMTFFLSFGFARADDAIFNGKDFNGWVMDGPTEYKVGTEKRPCWTVEDGKIICHGKGFGFLRYEKQVADFVLHVEYRFNAPDPVKKEGRGNSGIGIRTGVYNPKNVGSRPSYAAYEVQLFDDPPGKKPDRQSNASLYRYVAPTAQATKPAPEWNTIDIKCVGPVIQVTVNGTKVLDVDQSTISEIKNKPLSGQVCLQNHGSYVEFRNVRLLELKK